MRKITEEPQQNHTRGECFQLSPSYQNHGKVICVPWVLNSESFAIELACPKEVLKEYNPCYASIEITDTIPFEDY